MTDFKKLAQQYKSELLDRVMPFWMEHSIDKEMGGYFTCLERDGEVFDTDKFVWLQGREVWMLATLYNKVEKKAEWLEAAIQGAEFPNICYGLCPSPERSQAMLRNVRFRWSRESS